MRVSPLLLIALALWCTGCGDVTRLTSKKFDEKPRNFPIEVYYDQNPDRPFERIAILREASEWTTAGDKLVEALKKQARKIGADAILLKGVGSHTAQGGAVANTIGSTTIVTPISSTTGTAEAVAIVWIGPPHPSLAPGTSPGTTQPVAGLTPVAGLHTWQLTVNTNPPGALIEAYDSNQALVQLGRAPAILTWPLQTQADTLVLFWQGRHVSLLPMQTGQGVYVDFTQQPAEISGATVVAPGQ